MTRTRKVLLMDSIYLAGCSRCVTSFDIAPPPYSNDSSGVWIIIFAQDFERRRKTKWRRAQVQVAYLAKLDVGILSRVGVGGRQQIANCGSTKLIDGDPDRVVRKMDHEIPRKPRVDAWKGIAKNVELHEFDIGIFAAVLGDEIVNNV